MAARSIFRFHGLRVTYSPADDVDFQRWAIINRDVQSESSDSFARLSERRTEISLLVEEGAVQRGDVVTVAEDEAYTLVERVFDDGIEARYVARSVV